MLTSGEVEVWIVKAENPGSKEEDADGRGIGCGVDGAILVDDKQQSEAYFVFVFVSVF